MGNMKDKIEGKAKQVAGTLTDNEQLQAKGKIQEMSADLKSKAEAIKK